MYNPVFGNIEFAKEEVIDGVLYKWQKCIFCDNETYTGSINIICDNCKNERRKVADNKKAGNKVDKISDQVRWEVWERDNFTCVHCGSRRDLSIDHIYPQSKGGKATLENCQTLCRKCNSKKGAR